MISPRPFGVAMDAGFLVGEKIVNSLVFDYEFCVGLVGWVEALRNPPVGLGGLRKASTHPTRLPSLTLQAPKRLWSLKRKRRVMAQSPCCRARRCGYAPHPRVEAR